MIRSGVAQRRGGPTIKRDEANSIARCRAEQVCRRCDSSAAVDAHLEVAAIVHQHVAAAMAALVQHDAALNVSLNLRGGLCLPVPRSYVPHHRRQLQLLQNTKDRRIPRPKRWAEETHAAADRVLDQRGSIANLRAD